MNANSLSLTPMGLMLASNTTSLSFMMPSMASRQPALTPRPLNSITEILPGVRVDMY